MWCKSSTDLCGNILFQNCTRTNFHFFRGSQSNVSNKVLKHLRKGHYTDFPGASLPNRPASFPSHCSRCMQGGGWGWGRKVVMGRAPGPDAWPSLSETHPTNKAGFLLLCLSQFSSCSHHWKWAWGIGEGRRRKVILTGKKVFSREVS